MDSPGWSRVVVAILTRINAVDMSSRPAGALQAGHDRGQHATKLAKTDVVVDTNVPGGGFQPLAVGDQHKPRIRTPRLATDVRDRAIPPGPQRALR